MDQPVMRRALRAPSWAALMLAAGLLSAPARATTVGETSWQQLVDAADFMGVVECTVAGGVVARYRVVETWKGDLAVGASLTLRQSFPRPNDSMPLALVGERYLVTAYRNSSPVRILSSSGGGGSPITWRPISADYGLPHFYGAVALPLDPTEDRPLYQLGSKRRDLASFHVDVDRFLGASDEARAARLLVLELEQARGYSDDGGPGIPRVLASLATAPSREAVAEKLLDELRRATDGRDRAELLGMLRYGDLLTRDRLAALPEATFPGGEAQRRELLAELAARPTSPAPPRGERPAEAVAAPAPSAAELSRLAALLMATPPDAALDGYEDEEAREAFGVLTRHQPEAVVACLARWRRPTRGSGTWADPAYGFVSWFGWQCESDCPRLLRRLLDEAWEPAIRVGAAIYLGLHGAGEDSRQALRELAKLPGDSGAWAALALARRGDRAAVPRALEALEPLSDGDYLPSAQLFGQTLVLLSNTAAAHGLPPPWAPTQHTGSTLDLAQEEIHRHALEWWRKHGEAATPVDPWLAELGAAGVD